MTLRVLLAEDHPMFREGLRAMLDDLEHVEVVEVVDSANDAVDASQRVRPDVVVMDLALRGGSGVEATAEIRRKLPECRVLVLTSYDDDAQVYGALRAGAHGYVLKTASSTEIERALRTVADGGGFFTESVVRRITSHMATGGRSSAAGVFPQLTQREREVLHLMAQGRSNAYIADHFVLSLKTVRNHVSNILAKLGVAGRSEAVVRARDAGLGQSDHG